MRFIANRDTSPAGVVLAFLLSAVFVVALSGCDDNVVPLGKAIETKPAVASDNGPATDAATTDPSADVEPEAEDGTESVSKNEALELAIEQIGGAVEYDDVRAENTIVRVNLNSPKVIDDDLVHLKDLTDLQDIRFSGTSITGPGLANIEELTGLMKLTLMSTKIDNDALVHLKGLVNLKLLDLGFTNLTDAGIAHIAHLKNLTALILFRTKMTDEVMPYITGLPKLKTLDLGYTKVTDEGIMQLKEMKELRTLVLVYTRTTPEGVDRLRKLLPKCTIMR